MIAAMVPTESAMVNSAVYYDHPDTLTILLEPGTDLTLAHEK